MNMEMKREDTFHRVVDAVASEKQPVTFKQEPFQPTVSYQILVRDAITSIPFHAK